MSRKASLAKIHIAKKDLGLSDAEYRAVLDEKFGVESSSQLKASQLEQLTFHFQALGWKPKTKNDKPKNMAGTRGPLLRKIGAHLAEAKRPWSYAHAMSQRMFKVDKVEWCRPDQLAKIVAALEYDARRNGRDTG